MVRVCASEGHASRKKQGVRRAKVEQHRPAEVLFHSDSARALLREHATEMKRAIKQRVIAGYASTGIYRGKVIFRNSGGQADLEHGTSFNHRTVGRVYCMTKAYTAVLAMVLVDEGALDLDAPVHQYIPSMRHMFVLGLDEQRPVKAKNTMLVRHVLTHTAGFSYQADFNYPPDKTQQRYMKLAEAVASGRIRSLRRYVDELAKIPLLFEPGLRYEYGHSTDVLSRVLEVAGGKSLAALMKEKLFDPLRMSDTAFGVPRHKLHRLSALYANATTWGHMYGCQPGATPTVTKAGLIRIDGEEPSESMWAQPEGSRCRVVSGGGFLGRNEGGLVSTVHDTEKFVQMLFSGGRTPHGDMLLKPSTLRHMEKNLLLGAWRPKPFPRKGGARWCLLGDIVHDQRSSCFQQGGAAGTYWQVDRKRGLGTIVFMQQVDGDDWEEYGLSTQKNELELVLKRIVDEAEAAKEVAPKAGALHAPNPSGKCS